jgi:hypothetical protein
MQMDLFSHVAPSAVSKGFLAEKIISIEIENTNPIEIAVHHPSEIRDIPIAALEEPRPTDVPVRDPSNKIEDAGDILWGRRARKLNGLRSIADLAALTADEKSRLTKNELWPLPSREDVAETLEQCPSLYDPTLLNLMDESEKITAAGVHDAWRKAVLIREIRALLKNDAENQFGYNSKTGRRRIRSPYWGPSRSDPHYFDAYNRLVMIVRSYIEPMSGAELSKLIKSSYKNLDEACAIAGIDHQGRSYSTSDPDQCVVLLVRTFFEQLSEKNRRENRLRFVEGKAVYTDWSEILLLDAMRAHWPWTAAPQRSKPAETDKKKVIVHARPHLDKLIRTGPDRVQGRSLEGEHFIEEFGVRGVQFGNWVSQKERVQVVDLAFEALHDLADALEIPSRSLSIGGKLGLAFGSRGSGRASAHYEPDAIVINLTRLSGAGSLAHEIGHFIDHAMGGFQTFATDRWATVGSQSCRIFDAYSSQGLKEIAQPLIKACCIKKQATAAALASSTTSLGYATANLDRMKKRLGVKNKEIDEAVSSVKRYTAAVARYQECLVADNLEAGPIIKTKYLSVSQSLGDYFRRPVELFARSFECWIGARLEKMGRRSDYLVHSVKLKDWEGYGGFPYPEGEEREKIFAIWDANLSKIQSVLTGAST